MSGRLWRLGVARVTLCAGGWYKGVGAGKGPTRGGCLGLLGWEAAFSNFGGSGELYALVGFGRI